MPLFSGLFSTTGNFTNTPGGENFNVTLTGTIQVDLTINQNGTVSGTGTVVDGFFDSVTTGYGVNSSGSFGGLGSVSGSTSSLTFATTTSFKTTYTGFYSSTFNSITGSATFTIDWTAGSATDSVVILSGPPLPIISIAQSTRVSENQSVVNVTLTRSGDLSESSTVQYTTTGSLSATGAPFGTTDSDRGAGDYIEVSPPEMVTFDVGESTKTISITILDNNLFENDELITIDLLNPTNAQIGTSQGTVTIEDDDGIVGISIPIGAYVGTMGNDTVNGTSGNDIVYGQAGNDLIKGGGGNDTLYGNGGDDTLKGNGGNDTLTGGSGNDTMQGGTGNDHYYVDAVTDTVIEVANAGTADKVFSTTSFTLTANVEKLLLQGGANLSGTGNGQNNVITGNTGANVLKGGNGDDTLNGAAGNDSLKGNGGNDILNGSGGHDILNGGGGADTMYGGGGNDTYYVNATTDTVIEGANAGFDTVFSTVTYALGANVEKLVLQGGSNIHGTGNGQNNVINGNTGANVLKGGNGNDTLNGAAGNDSLKGNGGDDTLYGNGGNDTLNGGGGVDTLYGGGGNDTYYVNATTDTAIEVANAGADKVYSTVTYALGANVEKLVLQGGANLNGTGNGQNNVLNGNTGANVLKGGNGNDALNGGGGNDTLKGNGGNDTLNGGGGVDTMYGGGGNDTYYVNATTDTAIEVANAGADKVYSNVTYALAANVEKLVLQGGANLNGTGNGQSNVINGNTGANVLKGGNGNDALNGGGGNDTLKGNGGNDTLSGNAGNDTLIGGGGADVFLYTSTTNAGVGAGERIVDFDATNDAEDISLLGLLTGIFDWLGADANPFTATGNSEARFNDTSKLLEIDTNGDSVVDMNITLTGVSLAQLDETDFWWT